MTAGGPDLIQDGLVLCLDASDRNSYVSGSTTWFDLSGNNNSGSLVNGPTFNTGSLGSIVFDGVDDYVDLGSTTPSSLRGNPEFAVDGWFKASIDWLNGATWGIGGGDGNPTKHGINSYSWNSINSEICIDLWGDTTIGTGQSYSTSSWKHIVWVKRANLFSTANISIWVNGIEYTGGNLVYRRGSGTSTPDINYTGLVLGRAGLATNNYYSKPTISNFKIYNRALTASEVLQNYNSQKSRFGLT